jgi:hypothetical protein
MFLVSRARPARSTGLNVSPLSRQCGILDIPQPYRPPRSVTGMALLFFSLFYVITATNYLFLTRNGVPHICLQLAAQLYELGFSRIKEVVCLVVL